MVAQSIAKCENFDYFFFFFFCIRTPSARKSKTPPGTAGANEEDKKSAEDTTKDVLNHFAKGAKSCKCIGDALPATEAIENSSLGGQFFYPFAQKLDKIFNWVDSCEILSSFNHIMSFYAEI